MSITIRQAIEASEFAATKSQLGDQAILHLCEMDREYTVIEDVGIDVDPDGACALVSLHKLRNASCLDKPKRTCTHGDGSRAKCPYCDNV